jgi:DNA-binding NarL/FixJ family response regulator
MRVTESQRRVVLKVSAVRVVVVDDMEQWRLFISSLLQKDPSFDVLCQVADGLQAVRKVEALQPSVVLLDIGLPSLNGLQAGGWIRRLVPNVKLVFVSEQHDPEIVSAALHLDGSAYVLKSDTELDLIPAIHSVLRGEKFVSRGLAVYGLTNGPSGKKS